MINETKVEVKRKYLQCETALMGMRNETQEVTSYWYDDDRERSVDCG